jgi:hypothetical protein
LSPASSASRAARAPRLDADDRREVGRTRAALRDLSGDVWPYLKIARTVAELAPGAYVGVVHWHHGRTLHAGHSGRPEIRSLTGGLTPLGSVIEKHSPLRFARDPHEGRVVKIDELLAGIALEDPDAPRRILRHALAPLGAVDQTRVSIQPVPGDGVSFVFLFPSGIRRDPPREVARLAALIPDFRDTAAALLAVGVHLETVQDVARSIDVFDEPAWLCSQAGTVLHANPAAEGTHLRGTKQADIAAAVRTHGSRPAYQARRLVLGDGAIYLVMHTVRARVPANAVAVAGGLEALLPPSLVSTAMLAARGLELREIALRTGHTEATTRMYLQRIYDRLGVRSRASLSAELAPYLTRG